MDFQTTIRAIMSTDLISVFADDSIDQFKDYFKSRGIHHLLVEDRKGDLLGIISTEDMNRVHRFMPLAASLKASHIMTKHPTCIQESCSILDAVNLFLEHKFRALPVVDEENNTTGIVTTYDLMNEMKQAYWIEKEQEDMEDWV